MAKIRLVSNNQGLEIAKLARDMGLPRAVLQEAMQRRGKIQTCLKELLPTPLIYPEWVKKHLTPEFEVAEVREPNKVVSWNWLCFSLSCTNIMLVDLYKEVKNKNVLDQLLSLGHLMWYEKHSRHIPLEFYRKKIIGLASVVLSRDGWDYVPTLTYYNCNPTVRWECLDMFVKGPSLAIPRQHI